MNKVFCLFAIFAVAFVTADPLFELTTMNGESLSMEYVNPPPATANAPESDHYLLINGELNSYLEDRDTLLTVCFNVDSNCKVEDGDQGFFLQYQCQAGVSGECERNNLPVWFVGTTASVNSRGEISFSTVANPDFSANSRTQPSGDDDGTNPETLYFYNDGGNTNDYIPAEGSTPQLACYTNWESTFTYYGLKATITNDWEKHCVQA